MATFTDLRCDIVSANSGRIFIGLSTSLIAGLLFPAFGIFTEELMQITVFWTCPRLDFIERNGSFCNQTI